MQPVQTRKGGWRDTRVRVQLEHRFPIVAGAALVVLVGLMLPMTAKAWNDWSIPGEPFQAALVVVGILVALVFGAARDVVVGIIQGLGAAIALWFLVTTLGVGLSTGGAFVSVRAMAWAFVGIALYLGGWWLGTRSAEASRMGAVMLVFLVVVASAGCIGKAKDAAEEVLVPPSWWHYQWADGCPPPVWIEWADEEGYSSEMPGQTEEYGRNLGESDTLSAYYETKGVKTNPGGTAVVYSEGGWSSEGFTCDEQSTEGPMHAWIYAGNEFKDVSGSGWTRTLTLAPAQ